MGVEVDVGHTPGFFNADNRPFGSQDPLVLTSGVTTVTGNLVVALPRRWTEYTLRPYVVGGAGLMRARSTDRFDALPIRTDLAAVDVGGGVTGFLTKRIGLNWDVRYFRSVGGADRHGRRHWRRTAFILAGDHGARHSILRRSRR